MAGALGGGAGRQRGGPCDVLLTHLLGVCRGMPLQYGAVLLRVAGRKSGAVARCQCFTYLRQSLTRPAYRLCSDRALAPAAALRCVDGVIDDPDLRSVGRSEKSVVPRAKDVLGI